LPTSIPSFFIYKKIFTEKKKLSKFRDSESKAFFPSRHAVDPVGRKYNRAISLTTLSREQIQQEER